jgi:hypothetical protein
VRAGAADPAASLTACDVSSNASPAAAARTALPGRCRRAGLMRGAWAAWAHSFNEARGRGAQMLLTLFAVESADKMGHGCGCPPCYPSWRAACMLG